MSSPTTRLRTAGSRTSLLVSLPPPYTTLPRGCKRTPSVHFALAPKPSPRSHFPCRGTPCGCPVRMIGYYGVFPRGTHKGCPYLGNNWNTLRGTLGYH